MIDPIRDYDIQIRLRNTEMCDLATWNLIDR